MGLKAVVMFHECMRENSVKQRNFCLIWAPVWIVRMDHILSFRIGQKF